MTDPDHRQGPVLLGEGRCYRLELGQDLVAGLEMVKGQVEGSSNHQKSLGGQFFQKVSIGNVGSLSDKGTTQKVDNGSWLGIGNVKLVDVGSCVSSKGRT